MSKKYFSLVVKYASVDKWAIAFGDYDKQVVEEEREDSYSDCFKTKIIRTDETQVAIDEAVSKLNQD